ncbi:uncharacterized protein [Primulina eburnea]|uniref:uncharacterized protein n=1 Tax=Primulina eburnea TaxID=1245227 RepID=UPI003C6C8B01
MATFNVLDSPSSYNIILGRPAINELRAVASTYHQKIKFPVGARVGEVRGDQPYSRKCYLEAVRVDQSKAKKEGKKARIEEIGGRVVEKGEVHFVAEKDHEIIEVGPGISPLTSEHHLNILPRSHSMKQKKRHFGPEKEKVIDEHVRDLLKAGHIGEIQFLTWLSNVVLVRKSTGKWRMLKNAGATYQCLMNKVFEKKLCRNVEVYVDDILGKSKEVAEFIADLEETLPL